MFFYLSRIQNAGLLLVMDYFQIGAFIEVNDLSTYCK